MTIKILVFVSVFQLIGLFSYSQNSARATISVDMDQPQADVSPLLYGQFIEYLGRCIEGGIYQEGSSLSGPNGFRSDVLKAMKELNVPLLRFPGGTVTKIYHWQDGIGKKSDRPKRRNLVWGGTNDNHFGTAEFVDYCHQIEAEPFLVVNMATGTPEEASNWVEYCNGTTDTFYANLRRSQGYEKPFNVKYWAIGNEESAVPDAGKDQNINRYIEDAWQFVKLMKLQDPSIKIILDGNSSDMNRAGRVLSEMSPVCDFISLHLYAMPADSGYLSLLKSVEDFNSSFDSLRTLLHKIPERVVDFPSWYRFPGRQLPVKIAVDEWGIWDANSGKGKGAYQLEYTYNWAHALATAKFLTIFQRNADITGLATWAQSVNNLAPIMTNHDSSFRQTVYTPLQAFRKYALAQNIPVKVNSPVLESGLGSLDATTTISQDKTKLVISLVNLNEKGPISTDIGFVHLPENSQLEFLEMISYTAKSLYVTNTFGENNVLEKAIVPHSFSKEGFDVVIPAASICFLRFKVLSVLK